MLKNQKLKYVVVTPRSLGGGPIVLHELCRELNRQGCKAKVFYIKYSLIRDKKEYWKEWVHFTVDDISKFISVRLLKKGSLKEKELFDARSLAGCKRKIIPIVSKRTIVVYPEIMYGNILNAKRVVRWLLGEKNDDGAFGENDLIYCYRECFNDNEINPQKRELQLCYYDFNLYKRFNFGKREGRCYILRKGNKRKDLPHEFDGIIVDDLTEKEKVEVFNKCEYCLCYDLQSSYASIAAMCGCITIVVTEEGKKRSNYRNSEDYIEYGVAFGFDEDEIEFAKQTMKDAAYPLIQEVENGRESVSEFISCCGDYFSE